jgi:hypothetical protein
VLRVALASGTQLLDELLFGLEDVLDVTATYVSEAECGLDQPLVGYLYVSAKVLDATLTERPWPRLLAI